MKILSLILTLFISQATVFAFVLENDTSIVRIRSFNQEKLINLQKTYPYKYGIPKENKRYDSAFFKAFIRVIEQLLGTWHKLSLPFKLTRILLFLLGFSFFIYLIIQIFNIQYLFSKSNSTATLDFQVMNENIGEMDFGKLIQEAVQQHQYRLAIRLHYLHTLRLLSERKYIEWKINKTNFSYKMEMQGKDSSEVFNDLTSIFDWVWYGGFPIQENEYAQFQDRFENYKQSLFPKE